MAAYNSTFGGHSPNPLRPYYVPAGSLPLEESISLPLPTPPPAPPPISTPSASAFISDLQDYSSEYPSVGEGIQTFLNQAILQYATCLTSQPFVVAKTVLQCQYVPQKAAKTKTQQWKEKEYGSAYDDAASDDSDDEPHYFATDKSPEDSPSLRPSRKLTDRAGYIQPDPLDADIPRPEHQLRPIPAGAISEAIKTLWAHEGAWGIWKGQNTTFIYTILGSTLETWTASLLSAILVLPDPGLTEIADSTNPLLSFGVCIAASTLTALILAPLDTIRTTLMLTPSTSKPRNLLPALRSLDSALIAPSLIVPTTLHAALPACITFGTPFFLRTKLFLDPVLNAPAWRLCQFLADMAKLVVNLPLETVLRRAQIAVTKPEKTIVPVGRYAGVVGTAWVLLREEQGGRFGVDGLYRGWRVGAWGNVGVLGLGFVGVQQGGEF